MMLGEVIGSSRLRGPCVQLTSAPLVHGHHGHRVVDKQLETDVDHEAVVTVSSCPVNVHT